jgi:hypothetical protein
MPAITEGALSSNLRAFVRLTDEVRCATIKRVNSSDVQSLMDPDSLGDIERDLGIPPRVLKRALPAILAVAHFAKQENTSYVEELKTIAPGGLTDAEIAGLDEFAKEIAEKITELLGNVQIKKESLTGLDRFTNLRSQVVNVVEFDKDFCDKDSPENYSPSIKGERARILVQMQYQSPAGEQQSVTFLTDRDDIERMIRVLQLTMKQVVEVESKHDR